MTLAVSASFANEAGPRIVQRVSIGGMIAILAVSTLLLFGVFPDFGTGGDERIYREATLRWLGGGPFYLPYQLAGAYVATNPVVVAPPVLYPPVALWLFVPMALTPPQWWYLGPVAIMVWSLWRMRPAWWAWAVMLALCLYPWTPGQWLFGNPVIWAAAFLFLGVQWAGPAVLVLLKPVLFPFALWGANRRRWWIALGAFVLLSLPFLPMWIDYARVVLNTQDTGYLLRSVPIMLLPIVAWAGSERNHRAREARGEVVAPEVGVGGGVAVDADRRPVGSAVADLHVG